MEQIGSLEKLKTIRCSSRRSFESRPENGRSSVFLECVCVAPHIACSLQMCALFLTHILYFVMVFVCMLCILHALYKCEPCLTHICFALSVHLRVMSPPAVHIPSVG